MIDSIYIQYISYVTRDTIPAMNDDAYDTSRTMFALSRRTTETVSGSVAASAIYCNRTNESNNWTYSWVVAARRYIKCLEIVFDSSGNNLTETDQVQKKPKRFGDERLYTAPSQSARQLRCPARLNAKRYREGTGAQDIGCWGWQYLGRRTVAGIGYYSSRRRSSHRRKSPSAHKTTHRQRRETTRNGQCSATKRTFDEPRHWRRRMSLNRACCTNRRS